MSLANYLKANMEKGFTQYSMPPTTYQTLVDYVLHGLPPGGFVTAVLENNLMEAIGRADANNLQSLADICGFVYNFMPSDSWGSPAIVNAWLKKHGGQIYGK